MKRYWLLWTYLANYSSRPLYVEAENEEQAVQTLTDIYSPEFKEKATIYVLTEKPVVFKQGRKES